MRRPLVIFWGYCELHNASGQIARTFWEHLPKEEYSPTILCADVDESFSFCNNVISVKENRLACFFFKFLRKIKLNDLTMIPDIERFSWNKRAMKVAKRILSSGQYDYIHTIATPMSSHLLGLQLKKYSGLPLVVQCNDPWHDTSGRKYRSKFCANLDLEYEKRVAFGADIIIHSNQVIADIWRERYGEEVASKINVIPFSFNIYDLPPISESTRSNKKLIISHIGNIYSTRSSITVFKGIETLLKKNPEYKDRFVIKYIGQVHQQEIQYVNEHGLAENVEFIGTIAPEQLQNYYLSSDVFMIIDVVIKRNGNYPSKLMMYYYYRKPIMALTIPNSNLEKELTKSGHTVCYYGNEKSVSDFIKKAIIDYNSLLHFNKEEWKKHTVENVKAIYSNVIDTAGI